MSFKTLPRSRGTSTAAQRMREAGEAYSRAHVASAPALAAPVAAARPVKVTPAAASRAAPVAGARRVEGMKAARRLKPARPLDVPPVVRMVAPTDLLIEGAYQRDLSAKSFRLIERIVENWDWAKFKPPICAETADVLFIIDGQHTAIAAATHPDVRQIPVLVVKAQHVAQRAAAFVAHNRDRLTMSPLQVFHADVAANDGTAAAILKVAKAAGCEIPRYAPQKKFAKAGQASAISAMHTVFKADGAEGLFRVLRIGLSAGVAPIATTIVRALQILLKAPMFKDVAKRSDLAIAAAIKAIPDIEAAAQAEGSKTGQNRYSACAALIAEKLRRG